MTGEYSSLNVNHTLRDIDNFRITGDVIQFGYLPESGLEIKYQDEAHNNLPHIIKFSGGRSSGMMLMALLQSGTLSAERGDVVLFNNTSAEHPKTYEFVRRCKAVTEGNFGIPFFIIEHCTYEDARHGEYVRQRTFRLANSEPFSFDNPDGYRWRGEVYEELLSWKGFVPTLFQRTCTKSLKIEVTRLFLKEWLAGFPETARRGHFGESSRIDSDDLYRRHVRNGGSVPRDIFLDKRAFVMRQSHFRSAQSWASYSSAYTPFVVSGISGRFLERDVRLGRDGAEYVSLIGLRSDEALRVGRVEARSESETMDDNSVGEHIYMPLVEAEISRKDVTDFWRGQDWDLELGDASGLSNCTFCFLKGVHNLTRVREHFADLPSNLRDTPCDINWWVGIEEKYARDLIAEGRETRRDVPDDMIGFFGVKSGFFFRSLLEERDAEALDADYPDMPLPCDCTD